MATINQAREAKAKIVAECGNNPQLNGVGLGGNATDGYNVQVRFVGYTDPLGTDSIVKGGQYGYVSTQPSPK